MKLNIKGTLYECREAKFENDKLLMFTGRIDEDGDEIVSEFIGFAESDIVVEEGELNRPLTSTERIEALEAAIAMLCLPDISEV